MWEIVAATPGLRLPIVMPLVNRTISAPLNIHCDHSDVMGITTLGWIQIFSENAQEVYENLLLAIRVAEDTRVQLPAMVNQDGFITSHAVEPVEIFDDAAVRAFVGLRSLDRGLLDLQHVQTVGAMVLPDYLLEVKRAEEEAMTHVFEVYTEVGKELSAITGRQYPFFETYRTEDADAVIVVLNSAAGTAKVAVDAMRAQGKKVGLLKPILFRPFPYAEVRDALKNVPVIGVLDRSMDFGAYAPVYTEMRNVLYELDKRPATQSYIYGLGGRDIMTTEIETVFEELLSGNLDPQHQRYIGLRG
jgi:pyruvate ferredoxin oxidoreductase alpha subunit